MAWPRNEPDPVPPDMEEWAEQFIVEMFPPKGPAETIERVRKEALVLYIQLIARLVLDR